MFYNCEVRQPPIGGWSAKSIEAATEAQVVAYLTYITIALHTKTKGKKMLVIVVCDGGYLHEDGRCEDKVRPSADRDTAASYGIKLDALRRLEARSENLCLTDTAGAMEAEDAAMT